MIIILKYYAYDVFIISEVGINIRHLNIFDPKHGDDYFIDFYFLE